MKSVVVGRNVGNRWPQYARRASQRGLTVIELMIGVAIVCIIAAVLFGGCGGCGMGIKSDYSEGDRSGVIVKFSHKGLWFTTWEGELSQGTVRQRANGGVTTTWAFHASDEMASKVQAAMDKGSTVKVHYRQWWSKPWRQESSYDVVSVETVPDEK